MINYIVKNPLISVIVPCYNQAKYLDECLQSVFNQSYSNWECLIINDGSSDNTKEVAENWAQNDKRFIYIEKENGGVASARNIALKKSCGKYILHLDGDDKIGINYLQLAAKKLENGYDLVYCNAEYFGEKIGAFSYGNYSFSDLLRFNMIFVSAVFRIDRKSMTFFDENFKTGFEDWEFWISYLKTDNKKVLKLEETLFFYRINNISRNSNIIGDKAKISEVKMRLYQKHTDLYRTYFGDYHTVLDSLKTLEKELKIYIKAYESKRYKVGDVILSPFDKLKSLLNK